MNDSGTQYAEPNETNLGPFGLTAAEVQAGFHPDIENAASVIVATPHQNNRGWNIEGDTTQDNDLVAKFSRSIYQIASGEIIAKHIRIDVDPYFQDRGYAKALLKASFALYQRLGISFVELDAVGDGTLVWPRLGWSLHGPSIADAHTEMVYTYSGRYGMRPPDELQFPIFGPDILEFEDEEGYRIGEETLDRLARSNREVSMRLHLSNKRALASLARRGII